MDINKITEAIIGAAMKVHSKLGRGLTEGTYEKCLAIELAQTGLRYECQAPVTVIYDGVQIGHAFFIDILVERSVVVEVKAVETIAPVHMRQLQTYTCLADCRVGLLLNFAAMVMKDGVRRVVNRFPDR